MSFKPLGNILHKRLSGALGSQVLDAMICDAFDEIIAQWWQDRFRGHVKAKFVRDGALMIDVDHSFYAQEIKNRQRDILKALNEKAGREYVRVIAFSLMI